MNGSNQTGSHVAPRVYQLQELRTIRAQTEDLAQMLFRASKLLNSATEMDARSRKLLRQTWDTTAELFTSLAGLLHEGEVGMYPVSVPTIGDDGTTHYEKNETIVSDVLRELWQQIEWLRNEERSPSMLFSLERLSQELMASAHRLSALSEKPL